MKTRLNKIHPKALTAVLSVVAVGVLLFVTQVLLNAPFAILYRGLALGSVTALSTAGIILVYRTLRVINFAQGAIGAGGALLTFSFVQYTKVPFIIAFLLGLLLSGLVGFAMGALSLRFFNSPRLVLTVFTIAVGVFLGSMSSFVRQLPFFPSPDTLSGFEQLGSGNFSNRLPLAGLKYQIGDLALPFGFKEIMALEVALIALVAVGIFFRYTRAGTAVRAMAENTERASLLGISVGSLSILVWVLAGLLSGAGVIMTGLLTNPQAATGAGGTTVLLPALVAAVIGRMRKLPVAIGAAFGISILSGAWDSGLRNDRPLFDVLLLVIIVVSLLAQKRVLVRSEQEAETSSWVASQEPRPMPRELSAITGIRITRSLLIALGLAGVGLYPFLVGTGATVLGAVVAINAIVVISLVVLTGWAGQVSLGQYGFVALGTVIAGALSSKVGLPFWLAVPLATVVVAAFAALVGLPALRIPGLFLLPVTFAFAAAISSVLFNERYFGWLLPDSVERPRLLFFDFEDERSMYYLSIAALLLAIFLVVRLRKTRPGRLMIAVRENESNVRSFGVSAVRTKLLAFALSGGLAGFAGAIFAFQQRGATAASFGAVRGQDVFMEAVFGGVGSIAGALLGSAYFQILAFATSSPIGLIIAGPFTTVGMLYAAPGGLISLLLRARDGILKIIAQRRRLVVPGLMPNVDPEILRLQLWPLVEPDPNEGLAAAPIDKRYKLPSNIYEDDRRLLNGKKRSANESSATTSAMAALESGSE